MTVIMGLGDPSHWTINWDYQKLNPKFKFFVHCDDFIHTIPVTPCGESTDQGPAIGNNVLWWRLCTGTGQLETMTGQCPHSWDHGWILSDMVIWSLQLLHGGRVSYYWCLIPSSFEMPPSDLQWNRPRATGLTNSWASHSSSNAGKPLSSSTARSSCRVLMRMMNNSTLSKQCWNSWQRRMLDQVS